MPPSKDSEGIQKQLAALVQAMQESTKAAAEERRLLAAKVDKIPDLFAEQRRELERVFVPISRYDPERAAMLARMDEYDRLVRNSSVFAAEHEQVKASIKVHEQHIKDNEDELEAMRLRAQGAAARALPFVAIGISILMAIITVLGHVRIN